MDALTERMLVAIAALADLARLSPLATKEIAAARTLRAKAEAAWVEAGCPDLPAGAPAAAPLPPAPAKHEHEKDWSRVAVLCDVLRETEKAVLLNDGEREYWCPRSLIKGEDRDGEDLTVGDCFELSLPAWVVAEGRQSRGA